MPIQLKEESDGNVVVVHVSGKLVTEDYEHFVPEFERLVGVHGKLRVLFDMKEFHGWTSGAVWQDTKFALHHFSDIERLAMIGDKKWQAGMATFCKPFTKAAVEYFDHAHEAEARAWLAKA
ncbi:STAS/SEC14 domain-containing protein [Prosthecobacter sp.]|uniref:STAS/SEC14 domain-containing protein n=1 Tax=Prosthecobacter sp. TaxID=1965333 RepID=UPI0024891E16|nr:STAS/SEC14 domain-containing protein [Prosthecobacter sp.]MDI1314755.1 STAS/SEC14 domain-containing protein [Prosthecobacter sp.]